MKDIITWCLLVILVTSCGRKVVLNKTYEEEKKQEVEIQKDSIVNNIIKTDSSDVLIFEPIDSTKCFVVEGKEYKNVRIRHEKNKVIVVDKTIKTTSKNSVKIENKKVAVIEKVITKPAFNWFLLIWLIPILIYVFREKIIKYFL